MTLFSVSSLRYNCGPVRVGYRERMERKKVYRNFKYKPQPALVSTRAVVMV